MEESVDSLTMSLQAGKEYTTDIELTLDVEGLQDLVWVAAS